MTKTKVTFIEPMLLLRTEKLPQGPDWLYEIKLDGYRAQAIKSGGQVQLRSRNDNDFTERYAPITSALRAMPDETVLDGEVTALDEEGRPSFNLLQNYGASDSAYVVAEVDSRNNRITGLPRSWEPIPAPESLERVRKREQELVKSGTTLDDRDLKPLLKISLAVDTEQTAEDETTWVPVAVDKRDVLTVPQDHLNQHRRLPIRSTSQLSQWSQPGDASLELSGAACRTEIAEARS